VKHSGRFAKAIFWLWRTRARSYEYELPIALALVTCADPAGIHEPSQGLQTMTPLRRRPQAGMEAHVYLVTKSMVDQNFYKADGEIMFRVAQQGNLILPSSPSLATIDIEPARSP